jgi:hypothetical protein
MVIRRPGLLLFVTFILQYSFAQDINYETQVRPLMALKCFECHNTGNTKGGVNLDNYKEADRVVKDGQFWLKVLDQIKTRAMPPKSEPALSEKDYHLLVDGINSLLQASLAQRSAGHVVIRRLSCDPQAKSRGIPVHNTRSCQSRF